MITITLVSVDSQRSNNERSSFEAFGYQNASVLSIKAGTQASFVWFIQTTTTTSMQAVPKYLLLQISLNLVGHPCDIKVTERDAHCQIEQDQKLSSFQTPLPPT